MSDEALIALYQQNSDKELVAQLFKRHSHLVFGVCMQVLKDQEESKDAAMEVFERLLDQLKQQQIINFKSWLYAVTRNYALRKLKNALPAQRIEHFQDEHFFMESVDDSTLIIEDQLQNLEMGIDQLKHEQAMCVRLFFLEQKTYSEIEVITGFTFNEVKSYIQNGKRNLKIFLEKEQHVK